MKHWRKVEDKYGDVYRSVQGDDLEAYVELSKQDVVYVGITPLGDSTSYLSLDELKELVTICEAHQS